MRETRTLRFACHFYYTIFGMLGIGMIPPLGKSIEDTFGLDHAQLGSIVGTGALAMAMATFLAGYVYDRAGPRPLLSWGLLLFGGSAMAVAFAPTASIFSTTFVLFYICCSFGNVAVNPLVGWLYREDRSRGISLLHGFQALGRTLAPLMVLAMLGLSGRWSPMFVLSGVMHALCCPLFLCGLNRADAHLSSPERRLIGESASLRSLLDRRLVVALLGFTFSAGYEQVVMIWLPNYLESEAKFSRWTVLSGLTCLLVGYTLVRLTLSWVRWGKRPIVYLALFVIFCAALGLLLYRPDIRLLYPCMFAIGIAVGGFWPTLAGLVYDYVPDGHGRITSLFILFSMTGSMLFLALSGWIADVSDLRSALLCSPACALVYLMIYTWFYPRASRHIDQRAAPNRVQARTASEPVADVQG
jgi:MFS family permease